jgi:hypothetical protein
MINRSKRMLLLFREKSVLYIMGFILLVFLQETHYPHFECNKRGEQNLCDEHSSHSCECQYCPHEETEISILPSIAFTPQLTNSVYQVLAPEREDSPGISIVDTDQPNIRTFHSQILRI